MAQLFGVSPSREVYGTVGEGERWYVNPLNVVLVRPRTIQRVENPETSDDAPAEFITVTELLFVNTMGQMSSVMVVESVDKIREHLNDSLRGH